MPSPPPEPSPVRSRSRPGEGGSDGEGTGVGEGKKGTRAVRWAVVVYAVVAVAFLVLAARNLAPKLRFEDALIALRYARNLATGNGFVFNPGERIFGVTTPLHTLVCTVLIPLGREGAATAQNVMGLLFLALEGLVVLLLLCREGRPWLGLLAGVLVLNNLNLNYLYAGMEVHAFALVLLVAYRAFLDRRQLATGILLGVAFLLRYDAALMAALVGLVFLVQERRPPRRLIVGFCVTVAPWLVFAQLYFGSIVPQALSAKKGFAATADYLYYVTMYYKETVKTLVGLYAPWHLVRAGVSYLYPVALIAGAAWWYLRDRRHLLLAVHPMLHVVVYATLASDPLFTWHYYVLNPIGVLLLVAGGHALLEGALHVARGKVRVPEKVVRPARAVLFLALLGPLLLHLGRDALHEHQLDPHTRQLYAMGEWLAEKYPPETSLLQASIGVLGYVSGLRMVDHAGLVTPGLYYFDDRRCTPLGEVARLHRPDLVLLSARASPEPLSRRGYVLAWTFDDGPATYYLYSRLVSSIHESEASGGPSHVER